jgi:sarcosine oxidase subunit gamma
MSSPTRRESPLSQFAAEASGKSGVQISERPFQGHVNLRGDVGDDAFLEAAGGALGCSLPLAPNMVAGGAGLKVLWLGPDEWLIITAPDGESTIVASLEAALGDMHSSVTDVTGGQTIIRLSGPSAGDLLAKGCPLDLHPRVFGPGRCAQTLVAKAMVTMMHVDDAPTFDLVVRRSFADYLRAWLQDAAQEFGLER